METTFDLESGLETLRGQCHYNTIRVCIVLYCIGKFKNGLEVRVNYKETYGFSTCWSKRGLLKGAIYGEHTLFDGNKANFRREFKISLKQSTIAMLTGGVDTICAFKVSLYHIVALFEISREELSS